MYVVIVYDNGKFVCSADDVGNVDVIPRQLLENVVINSRAYGVVHRKFYCD